MCNMSNTDTNNSFRLRHHGKDNILHYIYIYAFSRRFYPKRLTVHLGYTFIVSMCSLGIEPTTFALLTQKKNSLLGIELQSPAQ